MGELGASGIAVSPIALGSWRTFERMERADAERLLAYALAHGIDFLDDARYDDETGSAPLPSGYSEVLFGELFRAVGASDQAVSTLPDDVPVAVAVEQIAEVLATGRTPTSADRGDAHRRHPARADRRGARCGGAGVPPFRRRRGAPARSGLAHGRQLSRGPKDGASISHSSPPRPS